MNVATNKRAPPKTILDVVAFQIGLGLALGYIAHVELSDCASSYSTQDLNKLRVHIFERFPCIRTYLGINTYILP